MGYFDFPHTRTYESDLGWLIRNAKDTYDKLRRAIEDIRHLNEWKQDRLIAGNNITIEKTDDGDIISAVAPTTSDADSVVFNDDSNPAGNGRVYFTNPGVDKLGYTLPGDIKGVVASESYVDAADSAIKNDVTNLTTEVTNIKEGDTVVKEAEHSKASDTAKEADAVKFNMASNAAGSNKVQFQSDDGQTLKYRLPDDVIGEVASKTYVDNADNTIKTTVEEYNTNLKQEISNIKEGNTTVNNATHAEDAKAVVLNPDANPQDSGKVQFANTADGDVGYIKPGESSVTPFGKTYTAGENVQISATNEISATDTRYTAGANINISDSNEISANVTVVGVSEKANAVSYNDADNPEGDSKVQFSEAEGDKLKYRLSGNKDGIVATSTDIANVQQNIDNAKTELNEKIDNTKTEITNQITDITEGNTTVNNANHAVDATKVLYNTAANTADSGALQFASNDTGEIGYIAPGSSTIVPFGGKYKAGKNVTIEGNTISAKDTTYTAGENVTISNENVISAKNNVYTAGENIQISEQGEISATDTKYEAGANIQIQDNVISASRTAYTAGDNIQISAEGVISSNGPVYTAGQGISISQDRVISANAGSDSGSSYLVPASNETIVNAQNGIYINSANDYYGVVARFGSRYYWMWENNFYNSLISKDLIGAFKGKAAFENNDYAYISFFQYARYDSNYKRFYPIWDCFYHGARLITNTAITLTFNESNNYFQPIMMPFNVIVPDTSCVGPVDNKYHANMPLEYRRIEGQGDEIGFGRFAELNFGNNYYIGLSRISNMQIGIMALESGTITIPSGTILFTGNKRS